MKYLSLFAIVLFFIVGCSSDSTDVPEEIEESIVNLPTISASAVSEIGETTATVGGSISNDGEAAIIEKGVVYGTAANPTINDNKQSSGSGNGAFAVTLTGLEANTTYFARVYATNSEGTSYGSQQQFTTLEPALVAKVFEGDVFLTSQQEIDDFGAQGYTEITGKLICGDFIERTNKITNFLAFEKLQKVRELLIQYNEAITNLDGFENLAEITENLTIRGNDLLVNLDGLNNVSVLTGTISINFNDKLETIDDFNLINDEMDGININGNLNLKVIDAFNSLQLARSIVFSSNNNIELIQGFSELQHLTDLFIRDNEGPFSVDAFYKLNSLSFISVLDNPKLKSISGFDNLLTLEIVDIMDCNTLESITGFNLVKEINFCRLEETNLNTFNSFNKVEKIEEFRYRNNTGIIDLNNFENLNEAGSIFIEWNSSLTNLDGFVNLEKSSSTIYISWNESLTGLGGFNSLLDAESITISNNNLLSNFCGLRLLFETDLELNTTISNNAFNPTAEEIAAGNCSL